MDNVNKAIVPDKFGQEVTLRRLIDIKLRMSDVEAKAVELGISSGPSNRIPNDEGRKEEMEDEDEDEEEYGEEFEEVIGGGGGGVGGGDDYSPATSESLSSSSTTNSTIHPTTTPDSAPAALNNTTTAGGPSSSRMVSSSSLSRSLYNNLDIVSTAVLPSSKEIFRYTLENQYRTDPTVINPSAANRVKTAIAGFKGKHCGGGGGGGEGEDVASTERGVDSERAGNNSTNKHC